MPDCGYVRRVQGADMVYGGRDEEGHVEVHVSRQEAAFPKAK